MGIIIGLVVALIIIVVVVNAMQQHKQKQEQEKRAKAAKQKAIIDETEELLLNLAHLPPSPSIVEILNRRSLNAAKNMAKILPTVKGIRNRINEMEARLNAATELAAADSTTEQNFVLPDNEQQLVVILQTIKKIRMMLKSEHSKGTLDPQKFTTEDHKT